MSGSVRATRPMRFRFPVRHVVLALTGLLVAYPFYYMVTTGLKEFFEAIETPPTFFPTTLHPENYAEAWSKEPWGTFFLNTIIIAVTVTLGEIVTAVLAAYAFARMQFRGKAVIFTLLLATLMIPSEATLIPNYLLMSRRYLGLVDTLAVQIIPFLATAFSIFLLRQFFLSIPSELADAARIDGAGHLRFLWSVVLPLSVPALVTVALITFLGSWNSFLWPLIMTNRPEVRPIQVGLNSFRSEGNSIYHLLLAAATFVVAPIVLLYLVAQRQLIQGVARTGIRG
ncbi:MAG: carbohydrate ABC transporter permease [Chloroflexi bacterium]|nr:carbohydrate ABC transporter permease [Chloroflexota bacterium]